MGGLAVAVVVVLFRLAGRAMRRGRGIVGGGVGMLE